MMKSDENWHKKSKLT